MVLKAVDDLPQEKPRRTVSLRLLLIAGFGGLVALSVGGVLAVSVYANFSNTHSLLDRQATLLIDGMERSFKRDAQDAERVAQSVAQLYEQRAFEIDDQKSQTLLLKTLLLSNPVVENIAIIGPGGKPTGMVRMPNQKIEILRPLPPKGSNGEKRPPPPPMPEAGKAQWVKPVLRQGVLFHNVVHALSRDGNTGGVVVAAVGGYSLNRIVQGIGTDNDTKTFVLNDTSEIIAHSRYITIFRDNSTIPIAEFPDETVKAIATKITESAVANNEEMHSFRLDNLGEEGRDDYVVIAKSVAAMSPKPYVLAAYFNAADLGSELRRARIAALVGLIALVLAVILAILFGNRLSKPLAKVSATASRFANLDLGTHKPLPGSRVREIDGQMRAMNAMHTALREFGHYVPKELVRRLLHSGTEAARSVEREITVMFTDVAGFTAMSEQMSAADVVKVLNEHFELLCDEIGACRGTVDKFMGDGLMAFWGAPEADKDHAKNAVEAARRIAAAFEAGNRSMVESGRQPLKLRIGIHTGRAVVGNIGGSDRHNYTVVGDIVNVASRLEQLGKELIGEGNIVVLVSGDCRAAAANPAYFSSAGSHMLRGRKKPISVFTLVTDTEDADTADTSRIGQKTA